MNKFWLKMFGKDRLEDSKAIAEPVEVDAVDVLPIETEPSEEESAGKDMLASEPGATEYYTFEK